MDFATRVSAVQPFDVDAEILQISGGRFRRVVERRLRVLAAGAADEDLAFVLAIEVQEDAARHKALLESLGTSQARLLIDRKEAFDGAMLDIVRSKDGQLGGDADTVVGTEGRTVGAEPITLDDGFDGVVVEVVLGSVVFLADHVHVRLEDDRLARLHARGGGFRD